LLSSSRNISKYLFLKKIKIDIHTLLDTFLQILPRGKHPCLWLTVPTAKSVADFQRQVIAHAGAQNAALLSNSDGWAALGSV
jgi:hypothetical protein